MDESALKSQMSYGKQLTAFIGIALLVVAAQTWLRARTPISNTDTPLILAQIAVEKDASLFPHNPDHPGLGKAYLPPYQAILRWLTPDAFAWGGMLRLFTITLFIMLLAIFLNVRELHLPFLAAVLMTLCASVIRDSGGGDYWGMTYKAEPLARYVFLGLALLAFLPVLRKWPDIPPKWTVFSLAAVGLVANFHPPSAIGWLCALALTLLFGKGPIRRRLPWVLTGCLLAGILAAPSAWSAMRHAGGAETSLVAAMPFKEIVKHILATQSEVFPWAGRHMPPGSALWGLLVVYILALVVWGIWWRNAGERRWSRRAWQSVLLLHLPFVFVLTRCTAVDLCFLLFLYAFCTRKEEEVCRLEWLALALLISVTLVCWIGSAGLRLIWQYGELPRITFLTVNFSRAARLIYLPMWLLTGLWVKRHLSLATSLPMLALAVAAFVPRRHPAFFMLLGAGVLGAELGHHFVLGRARRALTQVLAAGAVCFAVFSLGSRLRLDERGRAFYDLCSWARANTPKDALFLAPDEVRFAEKFAVIAQRTVVWASRPERYALPLPETMDGTPIEQYFMELYQRGDIDELTERAEKAGADYLIIPSSEGSAGVFCNAAGCIVPLERNRGGASDER